MKFESSGQIFEKVSNIKFHRNPSSGSRVVDMKLVVAFHNFANARKKFHWFHYQEYRAGYFKERAASTRWFKYDRDKLWLVYTQIVPVIFEPPCTCAVAVLWHSSSVVPSSLWWRSLCGDTNISNGRTALWHLYLLCGRTDSCDTV